MESTCILSSGYPTCAEDGLTHDQEGQLSQLSLRLRGSRNAWPNRKTRIDGDGYTGLNVIRLAGPVQLPTPKRLNTWGSSEITSKKR